MIPRRVELENFLTYGTPAVSFEFTDDEPLWVIGGPNGSGKSAVFDAITFALFGVHRGGKTRVDELVHHGADGLRVVFEFGFAECNYRITRTTSKGKALAPKLDKQVAGAWSPESRIGKVAELNAWVEEILGMDCEAFTSSVLLKQGEADKLFDAKREDRNAILKKIIGFEDYEELAGRVKEKAKEVKADHARLAAALATMSPVDDEALYAAQAETLRTGDALAKAQETVDAAVQRIERAKQWRTLEEKRAMVQSQLDAAKERATNADALRAKKERFEELSKSVPLLKSISAARVEISKHAAEIEAATAKLASATTLRDAAKTAAEQATREMNEKQTALQTADDRVKEIVRETSEAKRLRTAAEDAESAAKELAKFEATLTKDYDAAVVAEEKATKKLQEATKLHTEAETRFDSLKEQEKEFTKVKGGVKCSRCGQEVTKKHAEEEKKRIAMELAELEAAAKEAKKDLDKAVKALATAKAATGELAAKVKQRDAATIRHEEKLKALPEMTSVAELTAKLSSYEAESTALAKTTADLKAAITTLKATAEREAARRDESAKELETIGKALATVQQSQAARQGALDSELPRLPRAWADKAVTSESLSALGEELKKLETERVVEEYSKIVQDAAKLDEWRSQLASIQQDAEAIATTDRLSVQAAEASRQAALANRSVAEAAQSAAQQSLARLEAQEKDFRRTSAELDLAERQHTLHKKLDELLGESGLLRDLLRDAEAEVVGIADNTLRQLTNQDLSLEIDQDVTARQDKTFMLQVRKDGDPNPISLDFISGSQRFRVAVSLALAIGRFAAGKRRPIEAVIIDEGFGSLDEEGLRAMAENLQTLRRTQALKRIILVSHQKNFTDQFKAGYRLIPGPNGTPGGAHLMLSPSEPALVLAPMEGVTDAPMRALAGGWGAFTYGVSEFLRVSQHVPPASVFIKHVPELKSPGVLPVQVQLLGGHPERLAKSALVAIAAGALGIDLNFGCPAKTVNRNDGGATLLQYPHRIRDIVRAVRQAVPAAIPVSAKLRLGWDDVNAIHENAAMAVEGGATWITIHARTRQQGYAPPVDWPLVGRVREAVPVPVIANGDIWSLEDFRRCRDETGCRHFMLGRGALANPSLAGQVAGELGLISPASPMANDWPNLLRSFVASCRLFGKPFDERILSRMKQWLHLASRYGEFKHFEAVKRAKTPDEIAGMLA